MKSRLCLTYQEATMLADKNPGDKVLFLRILKPQLPEEDYFLSRINNNYAMFVHNRFKIGENEVAFSLPGDIPKDKYIDIDLPYKSGKIGLTETWGRDFDGKIIYKASYPKKSQLFLQPWFSWRSGITMPSDALRYWAEMTIECVRANSLSPYEMVLTGIDNHWCKTFQMPHVDEIYDDFVTHWNKNHAQPVKSADERGCVCYPWDRHALLKIPNFHRYFKNIEIDKEEDFGSLDSWKGEPLTILTADKVWVWKIGGELHD